MLLKNIVVLFPLLCAIATFSVLTVSNVVTRVFCAFCVAHSGYIRRDVAFVVLTYKHSTVKRIGRQSFTLSSFKSAKFSEASLGDQFFLLHINFNYQYKPHSVLKGDIFRRFRGHSLNKFSGGKLPVPYFP